MSQDQVTFNDGAAYEQMMGRWSRKVGARFLDWLAPPPGLHWIDVGCGNGAFSEVLMAEAGPVRLTGIDPSEAQIAYARNRPGTRGADFHTGDALALPFADNGFDAATMALVVAFLPDPARGISELARVTRPGGLVSTYMWDLPGGIPLAPLFFALQSIGRPSAMPPSPQASSREALEVLWLGAGLTGVETTELTIDVGFADFEDFWTSITLGVGPQARTLRELEEGELAALRRHMQEALPPAADGSIRYAATANAVKGRVPG